MFLNELGTRRTRGSKGLEEGKSRLCSKDNKESDLTGLDVADADTTVVVVNGKMWQDPARGQIGFSKMFNPLCNFLLLFQISTLASSERTKLQICLTRSQFLKYFL